MTEPDPSRTPDDFNPYAAPVAPLDEAPAAPTADLAEAERFRRKYLGHEASVKSIGSLHYLAAVFCVLGVFVTAFSPDAFRANRNLAVQVASLSLYLGLLAFHVALGFGLNGLKTWARWVEAAIVGLSFVGSLAVMGFGTFLALTARPQGAWVVLVVWGTFGLISGYMLYLLVSKKGSVVFSPEYRAAIARTPHVKYRTSCLVKFVVVVFVGVIVLGIIVTIVGSPR